MPRQGDSPNRNVRIDISGFLGMNRKLPSTNLDPDLAQRVVIPRELVNIDASKLPRLVPRPAFKPIYESGGSGNTLFPIFK